MNFQQMRYVNEALLRNFNLTEVAAALKTSQSGVSKQITEFEKELGIEIFLRRGKRYAELSEAGLAVAPVIQRLAADTERLLHFADKYADLAVGTLTIATTHAQARYALPAAIEQFVRLFPDVDVKISQGRPGQVARMLSTGEADVAIATEALAGERGIAILNWYSWRHVVVVRRDHPLAYRDCVTIADLASFPIITYDAEFSGRAHIDDVFKRAGFTPEIALTAMDADVIKAYVEIGMGVGIVSEMAITRERDRNLVIFNVGDMFAPNMTRIGIRKGTFMRGYLYRFVKLLVPLLSESDLRALVSDVQDD